MTRRLRGFTLSELMIAMSVLVIALLALVAAAAQAIRFTAKAHELLAAENGARAIVEKIQVEIQSGTDQDTGNPITLDGIFRKYSDPTRMNPTSVSISPQGNILASVSYEFPWNAGSTTDLNEGENDADFGMDPSGLDLNRDGNTGDVITPSSDTDTQIKLLPLRIVLDWDTPGGPGHYTILVLLNDRDEQS